MNYTYKLSAFYLFKQVDAVFIELLSKDCVSRRFISVRQLNFVLLHQDNLETFARTSVVLPFSLFKLKSNLLKRSSFLVQGDFLHVDLTAVY